MQIFFRFGLGLIAFVLLNSSAIAADYQYNPSPSCNLRKYVGGQWMPALDAEVVGKNLAPQPLKTNPNYSNFKIGNIWFSSVTSCLQAASLATSTSAMTPPPDASPAPRRKTKSNIGPLNDTNVRINPAGLLLGLIGVDVDFAAGPRLTVGPSISHLRATNSDSQGDSSTVTAWSIGVRANFYLSGPRFRDGWYFAPSLSYIPVSLSETYLGDSYSASASAFAASALIGYQWVWNSGFNITLGVGAAFYTTKKNEAVTDSSGNAQIVSVPSFSGLLPALEFGLGWAF